MDIFISYAHIDNEPLVDDYPGWVSAFHRVLEKRLRQLLGEEPSIWRDRELQGNDLFDDEIADRFREARLFVSVLSPRYVKSDYCQKELREFLEAAESSGGVRVGNLSRVIKVIKTPVDLDDQPEEIRSMLGYPFFQEDPESRRTRELAAYPPTYRDQFLLVLDDLAQEITATLDQVAATTNGDGDGTAPSPAPALASGGDAPTVYLGTATSDLAEARDRLRRFLVESGATVLPDQHLPHEVGAFEGRVREDLERCRLAIHPVGERYAFVPEGVERSCAELELALSAARSDGLERLIWMPPGLDIDDARQADLVERLQNDPDAQGDAQVFVSRLEALETEIERALEPRPEPELEPAVASAEAGAPSGPTRLYLIFDPKDADAVLPLEDLLWEVERPDGEKRFEVFSRLLDGDETEIREDHEDNLAQCDAFLVYHGEAGERWLRQQLSELRRARGLRDGRPVLAQAVWVAPSDSARKRRFRSNEVLVLPGVEEPDAESLGPFVDALDEARRPRQDGDGGDGA